jgi:hypothetical protein
VEEEKLKNEASFFLGNKAKKNEYNRSLTIEDLPLLVPTPPEPKGEGEHSPAGVPIPTTGEKAQHSAYMYTLWCPLSTVYPTNNKKEQRRHLTGAFIYLEGARGNGGLCRRWVVARPGATTADPTESQSSITFCHSCVLITRGKF